MLSFTIRGFNLSLHINTTTPELEQAARFYGIYSRVARKLGVTPQHVRHIAKGLGKSKRVSAALDREIRRIREKSSERAA
jgi:predicted transcriptional regulator